MLLSYLRVQKADFCILSFCWLRNFSVHRETGWPIVVFKQRPWYHACLCATGFREQRLADTNFPRSSVITQYSPHPFRVILLTVGRKHLGNGHAFQTVSRWLPTASARVRTRSGHVGFVAYKVALGQVFFEHFGFPYQSSFQQILHHHSHPGQVQ
jgi:hypothetical protein